MDLFFLIVVSCSCAAQDSTFEFERRRNRPERYDRNTVGATLKVSEALGGPLEPQECQKRYPTDPPPRPRVPLRP